MTAVGLPPAAASPAPGRPAVQLSGVCKRFAAQAAPALDRLTLDAAEGEFVCLLGPSGSGKTTALRVIAGYERPDAGTVMLGGVPANDVPAHRRNVGMVFQDHALFPHMTVAQNVAFGLRMRGVPGRQREARVAWALDLVRLPGVGDRYPAELSGGQQQRVAIARALAFGPALLLLDEPFASLDRRLRDEMRLELRTWQRRLGLTTIFVTHDQDEALSMADRIAVLDRGRVEQTGPPAEVYDRPRSVFVARFLGEMNLLPGAIGAAGPAVVSGQTVVVVAPAGAGRGDGVVVCLRAERLRLEAPPAPGLSGSVAVPPAWPGVVRSATYLGHATLYLVSLDAGPTIRVLEPAAAAPGPWRPGEAVLVRWTGGAAHCLRPGAEA